MRGKCVLKTPVRDVQKSFMSLSRIYDAGHRVVFLKDGGYIGQDRGQNLRARTTCIV